MYYWMAALNPGEKLILNIAKQYVDLQSLQLLSKTSAET